MLTRRSILIGTGVIAAAGGAAYATWPDDDPRYSSISEQIRKRAENWPDAERIRTQQLVRYATLAANSHNTQPWLFVATGSSIRISPDANRRCPVVDPDVSPTVLTDQNWHDLDVPTLFLVGENELNYSASKAVQRLASVAPSVEASVAAGADHYLTIVKPKWVTDTMLKFLLAN